jgi:asparagine synthase (glutamine-hydrolysing)
MCGICGKLNFDSQEPVNPALLRQMMDLLIHRGPDGSGEYLAGHVGLGHRRLSIIDLSTGDQPMCNEDGMIWVVFNGEIYNFQELRSDLEKRGHIFKSTSDTEVIVHLYEEFGEDCVAKFRGMFAFALWDNRKKLLLLARDRVGIKPLYYTKTPRSLIFASEIKSILADRSVERDINPKAIDRFLTYYYVPGNETLINGIFKLEPGHYLKIKEGKVEIKQYWDLEYENPPRNIRYDDAVQELRSLLRRTVKDHMISDVPVGVLLSGGVDSTGILRYAVEQTDKPIHTYTMGFAGAEFADERPYARMAAERYGTVHQEITMTASEFQNFLPQYVWHMEEPICEPPAVALYFVSHLASESSVKVLLSGEGGDEAFGGYPNYRNLLILERMKSAFGPSKALLRLGLNSLAKLGWNRVGKYANLIDPKLSEYYFSRTSMPDTIFNRTKSDIYTKEFVDALGGQISDSPTRCLFEHVGSQSDLNQMLYVDTKSWLPDDLLVKADKMTMATSVELRVPLLDYQVLEFASSLPEDFKVRGWSTKRILKEALRESIPKEIIKRKKTGFPVPYDLWLRREMKEFVCDTLLGDKSLLYSYFSRGKVAEVLSYQQQGRGYSKEVFSLLVLDLLLHQFADNR